MKGKIFAFLVVIAMFLRACSSVAETPTQEAITQTEAVQQGTEAPATEEAVAPEPVELRFSSWGRPEQNVAVGGMVAAFMADYAYVTVNEEYDPYDGYFEKKTTQIAGEQLPDVFALDTGSVCDYAKNGLIADISSILDSGTATSELLSGLSPAALANLEIDGKQYAIPMAGGAILMYYNKDLFDAAGLEYPNASWTFQDVLDAAQQLSADLNGDGELDQWGYYPNVYSIDVYTSILHRFGARWLSEDGMTAESDSPEAIAAAKFVQDLIYTYKVMPRPQDIEGIEYPFASGMVAMYEDIVPFMSTAREVTDFQWDVISMPLGFNGEQDNGARPGNPNFVVSATSENVETSMLLAAYMASVNAQTVLGDAKGRMPVLADGVAVWATIPPENIGVIAEILGTEMDIVEPLCSPNSGEQYDAIARSLEGEILTNNTPAAEEMVRLTQELQAIIDK